MKYTSLADVWIPFLICWPNLLLRKYLHLLYITVILKQRFEKEILWRMCVTSKDQIVVTLLIWELKGTTMWFSLLEAFSDCSTPGAMHCIWKEKKFKFCLDISGQIPDCYWHGARCLLSICYMNPYFTFLLQVAQINRNS